MVEEGRTFDSEAELFQVLRFFNVEPDGWPEIVDAFTAESGEFHFGRVDINSAPYEALIALPSLGPDEAAAIVQMRESLSPDERATIAWPAIAGIVPPEAYDELAGRITTRCWTYRLRLAAGELDPDEPDGPLRSPVIYEAVIDLSAPRPRVAYLRNITLLQTTATLAANVGSGALDDPLDGEQPFGDEVVTLDGGGDADPGLNPFGDMGDPYPGDEPAGEPFSLAGAEEGSADRQRGPTESSAQPKTNSRKRIGRWTSGD